MSSRRIATYNVDFIYPSLNGQYHWSGRFTVGTTEPVSMKDFIKARDEILAGLNIRQSEKAIEQAAIEEFERRGYVRVTMHDCLGTVELPLNR